MSDEPDVPNPLKGPPGSSAAGLPKAHGSEAGPTGTSSTESPNTGGGGLTTSPGNPSGNPLAWSAFTGTSASHAKAGVGTAAGALTPAPGGGGAVNLPVRSTPTGLAPTGEIPLDFTSTTAPSNASSSASEPPSSRRKAQPSGKRASKTAASSSSMASSSASSSSRSGSSRSHGKDSKKKDKSSPTYVASKEEIDEIKIAVWPYPENRSAFKKQTGLELDVAALMRSVVFRDAWDTFKKDPISKWRDYVRKTGVAVGLEKAKKVKGKAQSRSTTSATPVVRSEKTGTKGESMDTTDSNTSRKRDHSVGSSSSTSSWSAPVTKKKSDKSTPPAVKSPPPPPPPPVGKEGSLARELSMEELRQGLSEVEGNLQAETASSKLNYPLLLFVNSGGEERTCLSKETWRLFARKYGAVVTDLILEDKPFPKSDWIGFSNGSGVIATTDVASQELAKEIISSITVAEYKFRGWGKGEQGKYARMSIMVPDALKDTQSEKIFSLIRKVNNIDESALQVRNTQTHEGRRYINGVILKTILPQLPERLSIGWTTVTIRTSQSNV